MKIYLVDDEPIIVDTLKAYFEKEGYEVHYAYNGADAILGIQEVNPNFVILDLMLPDVSGENVCQEIRQYSDVPIMMLTAKTAEEDRINGIVIGADDYIVKPFSPREIVVRVQGIIRRLERLNQTCEASFNDGEMIIDLEGQDVKVRGERMNLTPIEYKLLLELSHYPGRAYSRVDLLKKIQDDGFYEGYERIIDVHIKNLRKKIEGDPRQPSFVVTVFGVGYKFGGNPDV